MIDNEKLVENQKTEEIQHIIERMPSSFGYWVTAILVFIFILMLLSGLLIRYPDIVNGQITLNATNAPLKLIANTSGKIKLLTTKSIDLVREIK